MTTLKKMPTNNDDRRIQEIQNWFDERGYDLYVHEVEGHGWRAPYMPKGSRIGSASYGTGNTRAKPPRTHKLGTRGTTKST